MVLNEELIICDMILSLIGIESFQLGNCDWINRIVIKIENVKNNFWKKKYLTIKNF